MSELTAKVVRSTAVGKEVKQSVTYCLQTCQEALNVTKEQTLENAQKLKDVFIHKLKLDVEMVESIKFVCIHRLRPNKQDAQKPRRIIVKFHWFGN